jgi:major membrane immunogen (membrane-anchored lipoprotein)
MKKFLCLFTVVVMLLSFAACGNTPALKDGTYRAKQAEEEYGWSEFVEITVSGGKITNVVFDAEKTTGELKSQDQAYRESMEPVSGTYPEKFYAELEAQLLDKQDIKKIEVVTGATTSTNKFILLVDALKDNMKTGDTTEKIVVTADEK